MDCDLARLLLTLSPRDLGADAAAELREHLATCPGCAAKAGAARAFDAGLAAAMREVPPPAGGRAGVVRFVEVAARARRRSRLVRAASLLAAVAVAAGLAVGAAGRLRPRAEGYPIALEAGRAVEDPAGTTRDYFADRGLPLPPFDFDYADHVAHGELPILGRSAPAVAFAVWANNRRETATAFALTPGRFDLAGLSGVEVASFYTVTVFDDPTRPGVKWAVLHTTPNLAPFKRDTRPDA